MSIFRQRNLIVGLAVLAVSIVIAIIVVPFIVKQVTQNDDNNPTPSSKIEIVIEGGIDSIAVGVVTPFFIAKTLNPVDGDIVEWRWDVLEQGKVAPDAGTFSDPNDSVTTFTGSRAVEGQIAVHAVYQGQTYTKSVPINIVDPG
jgi:hypothetical protein